MKNPAPFLFALFILNILLLFVFVYVVVQLKKEVARDAASIQTEINKRLSFLGL